MRECYRSNLKGQGFNIIDKSDVKTLKWIRAEGDNELFYQTNLTGYDIEYLLRVAFCNVMNLIISGTTLNGFIGWDEEQLFNWCLVNLLCIKNGYKRREDLKEFFMEEICAAHCYENDPKLIRMFEHYISRFDEI